MARVGQVVDVEMKEKKKEKDYLKSNNKTQRRETDLNGSTTTTIDERYLNNPQKKRERINFLFTVII